MPTKKTAPAKTTTPATKKPATKPKTPAKLKPTPPTNAPTVKPARASANPKVAPGAIPTGGTDTQVQARAVTQAQTSQLSEAEAYSLNPGDVDNSTLAHVTEKFNGVEMTDVPIPSSAALGSQPAVVYTGEAPALAAEPAPTADDLTPKTVVKEAFGTAADQRAVPPSKRQAAADLHFASHINRSKMTLASLEQTESGEVRCTFVIAADKLPALVIGTEYLVDIQKVPS